MHWIVSLDYDTNESVQKGPVGAIAFTNAHTLVSRTKKKRVLFCKGKCCRRKSYDKKKIPPLSVAVFATLKESPAFFFITTNLLKKFDTFGETQAKNGLYQSEF